MRTLTLTRLLSAQIWVDVKLKQSIGSAESGRGKRGISSPATSMPKARQAAAQTTREVRKSIRQFLKACQKEPLTRAPIANDTELYRYLVISPGERADAE
jgi:hypothetical protein